MKSLFIAAALVAAAGPALAQDGWQFALSPYVWLPGLSTSVETGRGTVDVDTSASDAISALDFAFMGAAEARKGKWGLILDTIYSDITTSDDTPLGVLWSDAEVESKLTAITLYAEYRVFENDKASIDLLGGGRFYSLDLDLTLEPGALQGRSISSDADWSDPVFGARARYDFTDKWFGTVLADMGGFSGGSDQSWQAFGSVGYQFNPAWSVQGGWRYMSVEKEITGRDVTIGLNGALLGLTYRF